MIHEIERLAYYCGKCVTFQVLVINSGGMLEEPDRLLD